jgi:NADH-quinone oxidoreductase subunit L
MAQLTWIVALIPAFPLLGFLLNVLLIRKERPAGLIASGAVVLSFIVTLIAIVVLQAQPEPRRISFVLWQWISIGTFQVPFGLLFDQLTAVMALLVTGVGSLIHIYSISYMHGDSRPVRYFAYLNLFIVAMLMLVMADNMLLLFLGWEGVGLCSFLLIGHWFERRSVPPGIVPAEASVKAFVVNRIGDAAILLAMMAIFSRLDTLTFYGSPGAESQGFLERMAEIGVATLDLGALGSIGVATAIGLLLLIGVTGKSAQFPLYTWLPDAMAGPTPVSALIHAATMVTAGVYLMARTHPLFNASLTAQSWVVGIGTLTALLAALAAVTQNDIKRVLAYSTISQLGYMVAAVGMGAVVAGMFHLLTHGVFKALLFLAAGSVIHGAHEIQDMRRMGGLRKAMPRTYLTFVIGALGLAGIFPLAGFWSKDEIIGYAWFTARNPTVAITLMMTSALTAFYMARQITMIFFGKQRDETYTAHESGPIMTVPLIILAVGTVLAGIINLPGVHWLADYLLPVLNEEAEIFTLGHGILATVTLLMAVGMGYLGWYLYSNVLAPRVRVGRDDPGFRYLGDIWRGAEMGWGLDWLYTRFVRGYRRAARFFSDVFDQQGIDGILVNGTGRLFSGIGRVFRAAQSGYVRNYALVFMIGVVVLVGYFALS